MTTATNSVDTKIDAMLASIKKQRSEVEALEKILKRSWETNGSFNYGSNTVPTNIQTASATTLQSILADLINKQNAMGQAAKILGIDSATNLISGFTYEQWEADFKKRVAKIQIDEKKKKLDAAEARLNVLVSPEKRREMELAELEAELGL